MYSLNNIIRKLPHKEKPEEVYELFKLLFKALNIQLTSLCIYEDDEVEIEFYMNGHYPTVLAFIRYDDVVNRWTTRKVRVN